MSSTPRLSVEAEQVLDDILRNQGNSDYWKNKFSGVTRQRDAVLRGCFKELSDKGYINVQWADNIPYNINVRKDGYTYKKYDDSNRAKLASMLAEADTINPPANMTYSGGPNLTTYNEPASLWVNNAQTFIDRHLKNHPLYNTMHSEIFRKKAFAFNSLKSSLKSVLQDEEYWEDDNPSQKKPAKIPKGATSLYDVFLSHANADKEAFVDQLNDSLEKLGIDIFYDKKSLSWGDQWKNRIFEGTEKARFAIIVISENFFGREWTEKELDIFMHRENGSGQKIILPIVHNITFSQLEAKYPELADIQAISSSQYNSDEIALLFARELIKDLKQE